MKKNLLSVLILVRKYCTDVGYDDKCHRNEQEDSRTCD